MRLLFFMIIALLFSCSKDEKFEVQSNWLVYNDGDEIIFYDRDDVEHLATIEYIEKGHLVCRINEFGDFYLEKNGDRIILRTIDENGETRVGKIWAENYEGFDGYDALGIAPNFGNYKFCDTNYSNTIEVPMRLNAISYNLYVKKGTGVIGIREKFGDTVLRICK